MGTVVHNGIHHQSHFIITYATCSILSLNALPPTLSLKQNLFDKFQQKWCSDMNNSSKGLCYNMLKDCFEFENYLNLLDAKDRQLLTLYYINT
jgi:hypothetical protein